MTEALQENSMNFADRLFHLAINSGNQRQVSIVVGMGCVVKRMGTDQDRKLQKGEIVQQSFDEQFHRITIINALKTVQTYAENTKDEVLLDVIRHHWKETAEKVLPILG